MYYANGSSLYALGLIHANTNDASIIDDIKGYIKNAYDLYIR